jgi:hypothetical protein
MGGANGWVAFGPGTMLDGALTLRIRSANVDPEYLYRKTFGVRKKPRTACGRNLSASSGPTMPGMPI